MVIRAYQPFDAVPLAALFYQTVHTVNRRDYTEKQLDAWAPKDIDLGAWDRSLQVHHTLVAVEDGCAVGFGDIDSNTGYLDRLYVHKDHQGMGIATALCDRLEASAAGLLVTHASITARPFFEKRGYQVLRAQQVERRSFPKLKILYPNPRLRYFQNTLLCGYSESSASSWLPLDKESVSSICIATGRCFHTPAGC